MADPHRTQSIPGSLSPWTINETDRGSAKIWFLAMMGEPSFDDITDWHSHPGVDEILKRHGGKERILMRLSAIRELVQCASMMS